VPQIGRRRLSLAHRHEQSVGADEIILLADLQVLVVVHAIVLEPDRIAVALVVSRDRPGAGQSVIVGRDFGAQDVRICRVEREPLLERGLVVGVKWQAAPVTGVWSPHKAGLDLEYAELAVAILVDPFSDRISENSAPHPWASRGRP
jgi:hypothetical protein